MACNKQRSPLRVVTNTFRISDTNSDPVSILASSPDVCPEYSVDGGTTWKEISQSAIVGGDFQNIATTRNGVTKNLTWDTENIIVLRNDAKGSGGDTGYPISIQTGPGEVFTIYYITLDDGITHVAGTIWNPPEP